VQEDTKQERRIQKERHYLGVKKKNFISGQLVILYNYKAAEKKLRSR